MKKENQVPHRCTVGKGKSILIAYLDNCGCSSFIVCQNSTGVNFLMINCNLWSKTRSMNFFVSAILTG